MRFAILSDIHANCDALAAVLADVNRQGVQGVVHLGDVVRYNTRPREVLLQFDAELRVCFTGHTHLPQLVEVGPGGVLRRAPAPDVELDAEAFCFINPGSVGQPRDGDERAAYAVFDPDARRVSFHRVAYDARRIMRDNARRGIKIGPRTGTTGSLLARLFDAAS